MLQATDTPTTYTDERKTEERYNAKDGTAVVSSGGEWVWESFGERVSG